ncbi:hypothetical protein CONPUDRAFT_152698 [Coniophora puteana RWD-64-598 SS2]|uniref:Uncharacterized protein n=1 Tax=Coniophora puteana (strain RWD-64-598) TaxID=741705 RepID=R7SCH7_CONPW|nr:uncharacterized protein CONPUDRAFT_152698 [Coniophora puteana RWD-64-598 SS2]XP_007775960.1 uncharacterized protein CONPUDRAFT_160622 [Coniophora puteana RWD-64-598 SS2]EIW73863.1 hypothetical protein CONPUDRAFT_160622 [Coniophora puteana RWD-64-598 SS2]EIW81794.1 hypothetical protein CONPUDRAFT_152698 [Coniophora puteana RWD-64-598 SS2]
MPLYNINITGDNVILNMADNSHTPAGSEFGDFLFRFSVPPSDREREVNIIVRQRASRDEFYEENQSVNNHQWNTGLAIADKASSVAAQNRLYLVGEPVSARLQRFSEPNGFYCINPRLNLVTPGRRSLFLYEPAPPFLLPPAPPLDVLCENETLLLPVSNAPPADATLAARDNRDGDETLPAIDDHDTTMVADITDIEDDSKRLIPTSTSSLIDALERTHKRYKSQRSVDITGLDSDEEIS